MTITVYTKPDCVQCKATYRALDKAQIDYETVDLSRDPKALDYVKDLGHSQAPIVVAGEKHWSGFRPERIKALAQSEPEQTSPEPTPEGYRLVGGVPVPEYRPPDLEAVRAWMSPVLEAAAETKADIPPLGSAEWADLQDADPRKLAAALKAGFSEVLAEARIPAEMRREVDVARDQYERAIAQANEAVHEYMSEHHLSRRPNHEQLQRNRYGQSADAVAAQQYLDRSDFPARSNDEHARHDSGSVDPPRQQIGPRLTPLKALEGRFH